MPVSKKVVNKPQPRKPVGSMATNEKIAAVATKDKGLLPDPKSKPGKKFYKSPEGKPLKKEAVKIAKTINARKKAK